MLSQDVLHIVLSKMEALDCAHSLSVAILVRSECWEDIAKMAVNPVDFLHPREYFVAAQAVAFLKKAKFLPTNREEVEARTLQKWWECERTCFRTNRRLSPLCDGFTAGNQRLDDYVRRCQVKMKSLLGRCPGVEDLTPRFGPGSTVSDRSTMSTVPDKLSSQVTLTWSAVPLLTAFGRSAWGRGSRKDDLIEVRGGIFFTVDKTAAIRRSCEKQPAFNVAFQLPIGKWMRGRLSRVGIDLDYGEVTHKALAKQASLDGRSATIDLTSASDCSAESAVRLMLPHDWFELLDRARTRFTQVNGKWVLTEKFSAMGNGFSFELETAMFLVAICALDDSLEPGKNVFVYGDDIIVPSEWSHAVLGALSWWGYLPNKEKTFTSGEFRESCGGDFFRGVDVRPYYWKENISEPARLISLANGLRRTYQKATVTGTPQERSIRKVWFGVLDRIPSHIRTCRGPEDLGDIVICDELSRWDIRVKDSIRYVRTWSPVKYRKVFLERFHVDVQWASLLYGVVLSGNAKDDSSRFIVPRDGVTGYGRRWVPFS